MPIDPNAPVIPGTGTEPPPEPTPDVPVDKPDKPTSEPPTAGADGEPSHDLGDYMDQSLADAAANAEAMQNPDAATDARLLEGWNTLRDAGVQQGSMEASSGVTTSLAADADADATAALAGGSDFQEIVHTETSARDIFAGVQKGDAQAFKALSSFMARFGGGTMPGTSGKPTGTPTGSGGAPTGNAAGAGPGLTGTPASPGDPSAAAPPTPGGEGAMPPPTDGATRAARNLTPSQRDHLAASLRDQLEHPPEGMTDEMKQNMEAWAQALEGDGEIPEEFALAMMGPEETEDEEDVTRADEGEATGEESDEPATGDRARRGTRTGEEAPPRSRTDFAVAYMATHSPGSFTRQDYDEINGRLEEGLHCFAGGEAGDTATGAMASVYGLRAMAAGIRFHGAGGGPSALGRGLGNPLDADAGGFGMADSDGVAADLGAGLTESIAHGGVLTLGSGHAASLWQVAYGPGGDGGSHASWEPLDQALAGGNPGDSGPGTGSPITFTA